MDLQSLGGDVLTTFSDRLNQIISDSGLTKTAFAKRIEVSQGFVSQLCSGSFNPSPRTISAICREFNVRREWLETGEGTMKLPEIDTDLAIINDLLADTASPTADLIRNIWRTYRQLTPDHQKILDNFIATLLNQK